MTRRKLVLLVSAAVFGVLGIAFVAAILLLTRTEFGHEWFRQRVLAPIVANNIHGGKVYIGRLSGNFVNEVTIDSIAIRETHTNDLFFSTGRVTLSLDIRDLVDNRVFVRRARVEHPFIHIIQHESGVWNFRDIFKSESSGPPKPKDTKSRSMGDYVVIDSTQIRNGTFLLTMPWHPDDALRGAARDSAIRAHTDNPQKAVARTAEGFARTYAWRNGGGLLAHMRLADPDSNKFGQEFRIASLSVDEYEPTFKFRNVRAAVTHLGDSIRFQVARFDMPASTGTAQGHVWWGSGNPVHYDIAIHGDSVSLDDVNWVYATLPRTGGGKLDLLIKNDPKNDHVVDFHLRDMDVRSTKSHLTGNMSFGTGAPLLLVRNVDLHADPVDFDLITTLAGKPFKQDWRGQLLGTVKARGGPVTHFVVDDARGMFRDAHVRGAESRFTARGELDILYPAYTAFHRFGVDVAALDLRTIEYLFPNFPRLGGFVSGTATLDSSWLDVRFSNARIAHQDGPGEPSRLSGGGRITDGGANMIYDVALDAEPLSLTMLARSYPALTLRGLVSGPIRAKGIPSNLEVNTSLQGSNGALSFEGRLDVDSIGGYGARGRGQFSTLNLAGLLEKPAIPAGRLSGHYDVDVAGTTAASVQGRAELGLEPTLIDSIRVYKSHAGVHFADGRMRIDSLQLNSYAGTLVASGGIGLPNGQADSLHFALTIDSLGGLRRYLGRSDTTLLRAATTSVDSLSGSLSLSGLAAGTMDLFRLNGRALGNSLYINKDRGEALTATFDLANLPSAASGIVRARVDTVTLLGVALDTIGAVLRLSNPTHSTFSAGALSRNGPTVAAAGDWARVNGGHDILLQSLGLKVGEGRWRLDRPSRITVDSSRGVRMDSVVFRNADSAFVALDASVPVFGAAVARLRAVHVPLRDVGVLAQLADSITGVADATVSVTGTKARPQIVANTSLSSIRWRSVDVDRVTSDAQYRDNRFNLGFDMVRGGRPAMALTASVPASVTLFSVGRGSGPISGLLRADTTDLAIIKALIPGSDKISVSGRLSANVKASGTWAAPLFDGGVSINNGSATVPQLGVTISQINGDLQRLRNAAGQDSIAIEMSALSDGKPAGRAVLTGFVKNVFRKNEESFALTFGMEGFHAVNKRSLAELYVTTTDPLKLTGTTFSPVLTGSLRVDHGSIFLADREIARKQAVEILADSITQTNGPATATPFSSLMTNLLIQNVAITLGEDVRLRSAEANVKLAGALNLVPSTARSRRTSASTGQLIPTLDLEGTLLTEGGTYNLNLGLVQREFQVLRDGTVTFNGSPQNPQLDIRAMYNVRRPGDRDLGVIVRLHGPLLPYPVIDFTSNAEYTIAQSDLVSYLLIGRPGFDYGANSQAAQVVSSFLGPSLSAFASDRLRSTGLGGWLDAFQFQFGSPSATQSAAGTAGGLELRNYLAGTTLFAEKQVKNIFLNVNTGFCQFQTGASFDPLSSLGAKAEYRFNPQASMKFAFDPPTWKCGVQSSIGLAPTPGQFSLSLSHTWRF